MVAIPWSTTVNSKHWEEGGYLFKVVENSLLRIWLTQKCTYAMWMSCGLRADLWVRGNVSRNDSTGICCIILTKHMLFKKNSCERAIY